MVIRSKKLREAARMQECTLQIPGVCNGNPETTVLAHLPHHSHGMGQKAHDISSCFACSSCHDAIDGRAILPNEEKEWYLRRAMVDTWVQLYQMGILTIEGVK